MQTLQAAFGLPVGLSDHTRGIAVATAAAAMGARVIEKHFTLDRNGGGPDDSFSLEPGALAALCRDSKTAWKALGKVDYGRKSSEEGNVQFRRSLYFVQDVTAGQTIEKEMVRSVRPGYGAAPKLLDQIVGKRAKVDIASCSPVRFSDLAD